MCAGCSYTTTRSSWNALSSRMLVKSWLLCPRITAQQTATSPSPLCACARVDCSLLGEVLRGPGGFKTPTPALQSHALQRHGPHGRQRPVLAPTSELCCVAHARSLVPFTNHSPSTVQVVWRVTHRCSHLCSAHRRGVRTPYLTVSFTASFPLPCLYPVMQSSRVRCNLLQGTHSCACARAARAVAVLRR